MRVLYFVCIVSIFALISSCSYKQNQILFENNKTANDTFLAQKVLPAPGSYHIRPLDVLQIRNLQNLKYIVDEVPTANNASGGNSGQGQTFQVEVDGTVTLPAIGHIQVAGLTRIQTSKLIEDLYRKQLLKDPIFEVKVINLKVTIFGEVKSPGRFPLEKDNTTLVELIGEAGGLTANANEKNIKIIRGEQNKTVTEINLGKLSSISDPAAVLQNGDIIYIAQNKRAIRNDNLQNITSLVQPALLLINTALLIFTLSR